MVLVPGLNQNLLKYDTATIIGYETLDEGSTYFIRTSFYLTYWYYISMEFVFPFIFPVSTSK